MLIAKALLGREGGVGGVEAQDTGELAGME
jgi:hypothetical protein